MASAHSTVQERGDEDSCIVRLALRWFSTGNPNFDGHGIKRDPEDMPSVEEDASIKYDDDEYNADWVECDEEEQDADTIDTSTHDEMTASHTIHTPYSAADKMQSWDIKVLVVFKIWVLAERQGMSRLKIMAINAFHDLTRNHRYEPGVGKVPEWSDVHWLWKHTAPSTAGMRRLVIHYIAQHPYMQFFNHQGFALPTSLFSSIIRRRMALFWGQNNDEDDSRENFWPQLNLCYYHDHEIVDCSEKAVPSRKGMEREEIRPYVLPTMSIL